MAITDEQAGLPIGEALKRTRTRQKLDIRTVEQQTKIRIKYLRALENEEWDVLPGPAYAKGFLRTYAHFLGLDGDALVDEYRRTVEAARAADQAYPFGEPVLERRLRPGGEPRRRWSARTTAIVALLVAAVGVVLVLDRTGGSGNEGSREHRKGKQEAQNQGNGKASGSDSSSEAVTLSLVTRAAMEVCLVTGQGEALIDAQTLSAGAQEGPFPAADNYRLDLDSGGAVTLMLDGKARLVRSPAAATYLIDADGIEKAPSYRGPGCP